MKDSQPFPLSLASPKLSIGKPLVLISAIGAGQWFLSDFVHLPGGGLGLCFLGAGAWWLFRPSHSKFQSPTTVNGWVKRCKQVLEQFEELLEPGDAFASNNKRSQELQRLLEPKDIQDIRIVSSEETSLPDIDQLKEYINSSVKYPTELALAPNLPSQNKDWNWPKELLETDFIIYIINSPLRAVDLLWLNQIPENQPAWLMVDIGSKEFEAIRIEEIRSQLPDRWADFIIPWNSSELTFGKLLTPLRKTLNQPQKNKELTRQRLLSNLHSNWQFQLESLRRDKFKHVQNKSQWLVAGAVFASPVPSTDLIAVSVLNGLMINDMAKIWSCSWNKDTLEIVAKQLLKAALAQGVFEWSGHALLSFAKLHGGTWLAAGTLQSLSAAYLTRVVGRSMSDWMALNNGVSAPDLEILKTKAPEIVERAAKEEKLDWQGFLKQSSEWLKEGPKRLTLEC